MNREAPDTSSSPASPGENGQGDGRLLNIPNQITLARLGLSLIFFGILIADNYGSFDVRRQLVLNIAFGLFILAAFSDFLDGYLARKWNMVSTFGRIADPIVDKVFICGSFVLLERSSDLVQPWFAVLIITREFLVSGLRGYLESIGIPFGAGSAGKMKMIFHSITVPTVIFTEANVPDSPAFRAICMVLLAVTALLTVSSCLEYLVKATRLLKNPPPPPEG